MLKFVLLYILELLVDTSQTLQKWRNAVDLHHLPEGTHSLAPRPGPLARLTFHAVGYWLLPYWLLAIAPKALVPTAGFAPALCAF